MEMTSGWFLSFPMNVSLTMNTDGVQVFHSSNYSLWPLFFLINELPAALKAIIHEATLLLATCCLVYDAKLPGILSLATTCSD